MNLVYYGGFQVSTPSLSIALFLYFSRALAISQALPLYTLCLVSALRQSSIVAPAALAVSVVVVAVVAPIVAAVVVDFLADVVAAAASAAHG